MVRPPRERPIACSCSPLFRRSPSGAFSHASNRSSACPRIVRSQRVRETNVPRCHAAPSEQTGYRFGRRTIFGRAIAPTTTALQHMHDAADDAPIVHLLNASRVRRQMRFDTPPLLIAQPKQVPAHDPNPFQKTNQDRIVRAEKLMSSDPRTVFDAQSRAIVATKFFIFRDPSRDFMALLVHLRGSL